MIINVCTDDEITSMGEVILKVYLDDAIAYQSPKLNFSSLTQNVSIPVEGKNVMRLVVDNCGDSNSDHADWADAKLTQ
ncbi:MAG: NPCBM/NEW2 domain-containing protein [Clostridia bacterium]|nr:NPCBM/NEW2 domain-containing protein [Clostridia bacterium]